MKARLLIFLALGALACWADVTQATQVLESALADSEPTQAQGQDLRLHDALMGLTPEQLGSLLPTAVRCLKSTRPRAQDLSLISLGAVSLAPGSSALLQPYLDDFDAILRDPASRARRGVIAVLVVMRPSLSPTAMQVLIKHLQDKANTGAEAAGIASAVLQAAPSDQSIVHQVITFTQARPDVVDPVIRRIGLSKIQLPEALDFVGKELDDPMMRPSAIVAVSSLDRDVRARFASQLTRIAQDPDEKPAIRAQATAAINGH